MAEEFARVMVTARDDAPPDNSVLQTPGDAKNIQVTVQTWYAQMGIRALRTYLQSLVGFLLVVMSGVGEKAGLPAQDFLNALLTAGSLSLAPAAIALIQNAIELLARMDSSNPTLRA